VKKSTVDFHEPILSYHQPAEVAELGSRPLDYPATVTTLELPPILRGRLHAVSPVGDDRPGPLGAQVLEKWVAVAAPANRIYKMLSKNLRSSS